MNQVNNAGLHRVLLTAATGLALCGGGDAALAASSEELLQTARTACLQTAVSQGWQSDSAKVISSQVIDADRVEIVFDLTKDGVNTARLTCPYSVRQGVLGKLGSIAGEKVQRKDFGKDFSRSMATAADAGEAVDRSRGWWLLLPLALAGLSWAALRGRDENSAAALPQSAGPQPTFGTRTGDSFIAEARGLDGRVRIHELADGSSLVRRDVVNGNTLSLTGRHAGDWLEVEGGGWVREQDLHRVPVSLARGASR
jgi:hypothetical protein